MPQGENNRKLSPEMWQQVIAEYQTPLPDGTWVGANTLERKYGVTNTAIMYHLHRAGVRTRTPKEAHCNGKRCKPITNVPPTNAIPPPCKCGCGQPASWSKQRNKWNLYAQGHFQRRREFHDPEWLRREYIENGRTAKDIAEQFGVNATTINRCIKSAGITMRTTSESLLLNGSVKGDKNPAWRGGTTPERQRLYKQGHWREFSLGIYARDRFTCQRCGVDPRTKRGLHAHHIRPWANNPALRFDPDNVITLCHKCHRWVHGRANVNRELLR